MDVRRGVQYAQTANQREVRPLGHDGGAVYRYFGVTQMSCMQSDSTRQACVARVRRPLIETPGHPQLNRRTQKPAADPNKYLTSVR